MKRFVPALVALFFALPAFCAQGPADPFGMDPGEEKDRDTFMAWVTDPAINPPHPLIWMRTVARSKKTQRAGYFKFFDRQTGLKGKMAEAMHQMGDDLFAYDAYIAEPYHTEGQQKDIVAVRERLEKSAQMFFARVPREQRVRVYRVAEKFEGVRLLLMDLVRLQQAEISEQWMNELREQEVRARKGYLYGMLEGRDKESAERVIADYKKTIEYMLTFAKPPNTVKGKKALAKFRAKQKKARAAIIKKTGIYEF